MPYPSLSIFIHNIHNLQAHFFQISAGLKLKCPSLFGALYHHLDQQQECILDIVTQQWHIDIFSQFPSDVWHICVCPEWEAPWVRLEHVPQPWGWSQQRSSCPDSIRPASIWLQKEKKIFKNWILKKSSESPVNLVNCVNLSLREAEPGESTCNQ